MASGERRPKDYYSVLGIGSNASPCAIRNAYRSSAMKWHPDKCSGQDQADAKLKFQEIQEAYTVLSDVRKKELYDNGLYNANDDDEDIEGLSGFIREMSGMMTEKGAKGSTFEELQQLFVDMFSTDIDMATFNFSCSKTAPSMHFNKKRSWVGHEGTPIYNDKRSCIKNGRFPPSEVHVRSMDSFDNGSVLAKDKDEEDPFARESCLRSHPGV